MSLLGLVETVLSIAQQARETMTNDVLLWAITHLVVKHCEDITMLFLLFVIIPHTIFALSFNNRWYEFASTISLECKMSDLRAATSNGSCALLASVDEIYSFGFALHDGTCISCRAGGMLGDAGVVEISITGPFFVQGKELQLVHNTLEPRQDGCYFCRRLVQIHFLEWNLFK